MSEPGDVTRLLRQIADGDEQARNELIALVYDELRRLAAVRMRGEASDHTLQATALVHEAYLRLAKPSGRIWDGRTHFFAVASKVMRQILVDHARARLADKRGGATVAAENVDPDGLPGLPMEAEQILALDDALTRLAAFDKRQCQVVELRFFAGMSVEETADHLAISPRTVKRDWQLARAWLFGELGA